MKLEKTVLSVKVTEGIPNLAKIGAKNLNKGAGDYIQYLIIQDLTKNFKPMKDAKTLIEEFDNNIIIESFILSKLENIFNESKNNLCVEVEELKLMIHAELLSEIFGKEVFSSEASYTLSQLIYTKNVVLDNSIITLLNYIDFVIDSITNSNLLVESILHLSEYIIKQKGNENMDATKLLLTKINNYESFNLSLLVHSFSFATTQNRKITVREYLDKPHLKCILNIELDKIFN